MKFPSRDAGTVQINICRVRIEIVDDYQHPAPGAGAQYDDEICLVIEFDFNFALTDDRELILGNLVALRKVRIEIVLPVKSRPQIDLCIEAQTRADGRFHAAHITGNIPNRSIDQTDIAVGSRRKPSGRQGSFALFAT